MKKSLLIALVGLMFFVFASCSGTKQYEDVKDLYEETIKQVKDAKRCKDLDKIEIKFTKRSAKIAKRDYDYDEEMTSEEEDKIEKLQDELNDLFDEKRDKFDCDSNGYYYDD